MTAPQFLAKMYGFNGNFDLIRQSWSHPRNLYQPKNSNFIEFLRNLGEKISGEQSHLIWEFEAKK